MRKTFATSAPLASASTSNSMPSSSPLMSFAVALVLFISLSAALYLST